MAVFIIALKLTALIPNLRCEVAIHLQRGARPSVALFVRWDLQRLIPRSSVSRRQQVTPQLQEMLVVPLPAVGGPLSLQVRRLFRLLMIAEHRALLRAWRWGGH